MKKFLGILKKCLIALLILASLIIVANTEKSHADAGYHSSYSGGSSSHSSSSYSSSSSSSRSSRSSGSSYSSSSYSSDGSGGGGLFGVAVFITIIIIIVVLSRSKGKPSTSIAKLQNNQAALAKIKGLIPDFDEKQFLQDGYKIFLDVEDAWMNFDLDKVRNSITDEMFNMYESQLSSMEIKGEQNVMSGFELKDCAISSCNNQNDDIEITTKYIIEFYDYIIEKESGKVLRGSKTHKLRMYYDMTFVKSQTHGKITNCPNCGAEVNVNSSGVCEYCGSKIVGEHSDWVMSKKLCTKQINL